MAPLILDGDLLLIEPGPQWKHKTIVADLHGQTGSVQAAPPPR